MNCLYSIYLVLGKSWWWVGLVFSGICFWVQGRSKRVRFKPLGSQSQVCRVGGDGSLIYSREDRYTLGGASKGNPGDVPRALLSEAPVSAESWLSWTAAPLALEAKEGVSLRNGLR